MRINGRVGYVSGGIHTERSDIPRSPGAIQHGVNFSGYMDQTMPGHQCKTDSQIIDPRPDVPIGINQVSRYVEHIAGVVPCDDDDPVSGMQDVTLNIENLVCP